MSSKDEKNPKKPSRRDRFSKAIRNDLEQGAGDTFSSAGYHDEKKEISSEKSLSGQNKQKNAHAMQDEQKGLRKIDQGALKAADLKYKGRSSWGKVLLWGTIVSVVLIMGYFLFFTSVQQPRLYLATAPIEKGQLSTLPYENLAFDVNHQIYLYYDPIGVLGADRLFIRTDKVLRDVTGKLTEEPYRYFEIQVDSQWRFFRTLFQENFFTTGQEYRISVLNQGGKVLAEQLISIPQ